MNAPAAIPTEKADQLAHWKQLNEEKIFRQGFRIEQDVGPKAYRDVKQAINMLINFVPSGICLPQRELKVRATCLAWLAGVLGAKTSEEELKRLK